MPVFVSHLKTGGSLILSGLLSSQVEHLLSHLPSVLECVNKTQQEDWVRLDISSQES
jgi:ribosomal protein L11 methylase PrmA